MLPRGQAPKARSQPGTSCVAHARTVAGACPYNHVVYHGVPFAMTVAMRQAWQEWALQIVGGAAIVFIGLYLIGALKTRLLQPCGSALGFALKGGRLHRLGRVSSGAAFAIYCAGCCGPLLYPLFLFSATSGSAVVGAAVAMGFALAMAVPIGILGSLGQRSFSWVGSFANNYDAITRASGVALLTFGGLLMLYWPLISLIAVTHYLLG